MAMLLTIAVYMYTPIFLCSILMTDYKLDKMKQGVKGCVVGSVVGRNGKKKRPSP
jgi:hypothetical protein